MEGKILLYEAVCKLPRAVCDLHADGPYTSSSASLKKTSDIRRVQKAMDMDTLTTTMKIMSGCSMLTACWKPFSEVVWVCERVTARPSLSLSLSPEMKIIRLAARREWPQTRDRESSTTAHMNPAGHVIAILPYAYLRVTAPVSYIFQNFEWPLTLISSQQT